MKFKEFLDELKLEKYIGIFILVFFVFIYIINRKICNCKKNIENMTILDDKEITNAINRYYLSNDFVRTMTSVTQKIQINGPQIVGDIIITGNVKVDGEISNQNTSYSDFNVKIDKKIIEMKVKADRIAAEKAIADKAAADKAAADKIIADKAAVDKAAADKAAADKLALMKEIERRLLLTSFRPFTFNPGQLSHLKLMELTPTTKASPYLRIDFFSQKFWIFAAFNNTNKELLWGFYLYRFQDREQNNFGRNMIGLDFVQYSGGIFKIPLAQFGILSVNPNSILSKINLQTIKINPNYPLFSRTDKESVMPLNFLYNDKIIKSVSIDLTSIPNKNITFFEGWKT